jgi:hypothetical protein
MRRLAIAILAAATAVTAACGNVNDALARLSDARRVSADLLVEFTKASDASSQAVMADTDASSVAFAQQAAAAKQAVHKDAVDLRPLLIALGYSDETQLLDRFQEQFAAYEAADRQILDLAVENTNLKAQRLSFGAAQAEADTFEQSVNAVAPANARDIWQVKAARASAVGAVREIQVLQAPHIAAADEAAMAGIETRMKAQETTARDALATLSSIGGAAARPALAAATDALNRFMDLNAQIVKLSRQNTNVRSLALSLDQKPKLAQPCEQTLRALGDALAHHGYPKGRWD